MKKSTKGIIGIIGGLAVAALGLSSLLKKEPEVEDCDCEVEEITDEPIESEDESSDEE